MHELASLLLTTIRKRQFMRPGDRVAAAVSGGADSVALLCLLLELRAELGIVLSIAHVNHKLRGEESDEDERFVAELARQHGLDLHVRQAPVGEKDGINSGVEGAARALRYDFFRELAQEGRVTKIATAHTLDDQAETVLLRIFRGTGMRGLAGIHPRIIFEGQSQPDQCRPFGEVVRPLLGFRHASLQEFLRKQDQSWREDSSNRNLAFLRNRIRHRLLPMITEEFGESAIEHMAELAEIARAEDEHWNRGHPEVRTNVRTDVQAESSRAGSISNDEAQQSVTLPAGHLLALPLAAQRRLVRGWLETNAHGLDISFRLIEQALELAGEPAGRKVEMPSGWNLRRGRQDLLLEFEDNRKKTSNYEYALPIPGAVEVPELGVRIEARIVDMGRVSEGIPECVPENERGQLLDPRSMGKVVLVRNWRPGDRFWPAHTAAAKKVKELLSDRHATGAEKKLWPVAVAEGCGLVWMRGFAVPAAFRAPAGSAQAIWIREIAGMM